MRAAALKSPKSIELDRAYPEPPMNPADLKLRVEYTGICGSDLHMYDGRTPLEKGTVVGHEIMGVIEEVGDAV